MLSGKKTPKSGLSPSHEHYLRAIWEMRTRHGYARLTDVARELGISHPTLSVGLQPLERRRLITHDARRFLALTPRGERLAREVHHRFRVVRAFLVDVLGVPAADAEREACLIEHDIGAATTERLVDLLKLMEEDRGVRSLFHDRFPRYHRACGPGAACSTCGLSCLTPDVPARSIP
jgi:Mn-dependent DtxR family transcriptional regulator